MPITQSHDIEIEPYYPMTFRKFVRLHKQKESASDFWSYAFADSMAQEIREEIDKGILESLRVMPRKTTI